MARNHIAMMNHKLLIRAILEDYALPTDGTHGVSHWARGMENGLRLAELTNANKAVVRLFALFHDSKRVNEGTDHDHGRRGAEFAASLRGNLFDLPDDQFDLLHAACSAHTDGLTDADITIQTCWDADRLDLGRVGIMPQPSRLCNDAAMSPETIKWADGRATFRVVPEFVKDEWGIGVNG